MNDDPQVARTVQIYRIYIKASPQAIWDAFTRPEWTARYGYAMLAEYELRPGGAFRAHANEGMKAFPGIPDVISEGEVLEVDAPYRLVHTWHMTMTPELAAEAVTRLMVELEPVRGGVTRVTVTHDVTGAPLWAHVLAGGDEAGGSGGGWNEVLSGLKTLLETGEPLPFQSGRPRES